MSEYGPEIAVNGAQPKWLADDEDVLPKAGSWARFTMKPGMWSWSEITAIRLPADHWAYPVIANGFEPWAGGGSEPDDWDKGLVLLCYGFTAYVLDYRKWNGSDIIGYHKRKAVDPYAHADGSRECRPIGPDAPLTYNPEKCAGERPNHTWSHCEIIVRAGEAFDPLNLNKYVIAPKETHVLVERMTEDEARAVIRTNITWGDWCRMKGIIKPDPDPIAEYAARKGLDEAELRALLEAAKC